MSIGICMHDNHSRMVVANCNEPEKTEFSLYRNDYRPKWRPRGRCGCVADGAVAVLKMNNRGKEGSCSSIRLLQTDYKEKDTCRTKWWKKTPSINATTVIAPYKIWQDTVTRKKVLRWKLTRTSYTLREGAVSSKWKVHPFAGSKAEKSLLRIFLLMFILCIQTRPVSPHHTTKGTANIMVRMQWGAALDQHLSPGGPQSHRKCYRSESSGQMKILRLKSQTFPIMYYFLLHFTQFEGVVTAANCGSWKCSLWPLSSLILLPLRKKKPNDEVSFRDNERINRWYITSMQDSL